MLGFPVAMLGHLNINSGQSGRHAKDVNFKLTREGPAPHKAHLLDTSEALGIGVKEKLILFRTRVLGQKAKQIQRCFQKNIIIAFLGGEGATAHKLALL